MARSRRAEPDTSRRAEESIGATEARGIATPSRERNARKPGADAARAAELDSVLLSDLERGHVVVDLRAGETLTDQQFGKHVVMEVESGRILVNVSDESREFGAGALVIFDPGELHTLRGLVATRLVFDLRENGFATRPRPATGAAKESRFSTAPDWVLCLAVLAGVLLILFLILLTGLL